MKENENNSRFLLLAKFFIICLLTSELLLALSPQGENSNNSLWFSRGAERKEDLKKVKASNDFELNRYFYMHKLPEGSLDIPLESKKQTLVLQSPIPIENGSVIFREENDETTLIQKSADGREHEMTFRIEGIGTAETVLDGNEKIERRFSYAGPQIQELYDNYLRQKVVFSSSEYTSKVGIAVKTSKDAEVSSDFNGSFTLRTKATKEHLVMFRQPQGVDSHGNRVDFRYENRGKSLILIPSDERQIRGAEYPIEVYLDVVPVLWSEALVKIGESCIIEESCERDGDLIEVRSAGWNWGTRERSSNEFVIIQIPKVSENDIRMLLRRTENTEEDIEAGEEEVLDTEKGLVRYGIDYTTLLKPHEVEELREGRRGAKKIDLKKPEKYVVINEESVNLPEKDSTNDKDQENSKRSISEVVDNNVSSSATSTLTSKEFTPITEVSELKIIQIISRPFENIKNIFDLLKKKNKKIADKKAKDEEQSYDVLITGTTTKANEQLEPKKEEQTSSDISTSTSIDTESSSNTTSSEEVGASTTVSKPAPGDESQVSSSTESNISVDSSTSTQVNPEESIKAGKISDPSEDISNNVTTTLLIPEGMELSTLIVTSSISTDNINQEKKESPEEIDNSPREDDSIKDESTSSVSIFIKKNKKTKQLEVKKMADEGVGVIKKKANPRLSVVPMERRLVYKPPKPDNFFKRIVKRLTKGSKAATTNVYTIGTASRNYSTISAWEAARSANLVSLDYIERGDCYADSVITESDNTVIDNTNSFFDSNHYMWLTAASGQEHKGTTASGVKITTAGTSDILDLSDPSIVIEKLIFYGWGSGGTYDRALQIDSSNGNIRVRYNIFDARYNVAATGIRLDGDNHSIYSNIIMNLPGGGAASAGIGLFHDTGADGNKFYNNTIFNASSGVVGTDVTTDVLLKNNIVASATRTYSGTFHAESGYNMSSNASTTGSSTDITWIPADNSFVNTASGSIDLHLRAGARALDAGITVASGTEYFTGDMDLETRGTDFGYDMGADEVTFSEAAWSRCRVVYDFGTTTAAWGANTTTTVVSLSPELANTTSSFLFPVNSTLGTGNTTTEQFVLSGYTSGTANIVLDRSGTSTSLLGYSYHLLECFDGEFSVQRGSVTMNALVTSTSVSITTIESPTSAIVLVLPKPDTNYNYPMTTALATGKLVSSSSLSITRDNTASGTAVTVRYEVISFPTSSGVRIRSGEVDASFASSMTSTQSITSVSTTASLLFCQFHSNTDTLTGVTLGCNLASSTGVDFTHGVALAGLTNKIQYYVIQFPSGTVSIQRGNAFDNIEVADGSWYDDDFTLTGIRFREKALPFLTWYSTNTTGKAPPRERWIYGLSSTSTLKTSFRRPTTGAGADNYKYWQVAQFPGPSVTQAGYRWFSNVDAASVGSGLASQNSSATVSNVTPVRLRMLLRMTGRYMPTSSQTYFRLQYSTSSGGVGTCDTSFSGENYVNVSGVFKFLDNPSVANSATAVASSGDPTDGGNTIRMQSYKEENYFGNSVNRIGANEDGLWDFSVSSTYSVAGYTYCFRAVHQNGDLLQSYSQIPEITYSSSDSWLNINWLNRKKITFNNISSTSDLVNYPIAVVLNSSKIDYSKTQSAGQDIRFTDSDGTTQLYYEIENWDESGTSTVFVKVPQINGTSTDDFIYMYYNNPDAADNSTTSSVWDSNYIGVWHLDEDPSSTAPQAQNSTANDYDGTAGGSMTSSQLVAGVLGRAWNFDGNDSVSVSDGALWDPTSTVTMEAWIIPQNFVGNNGGIINHDLSNPVYTLHFNTAANGPYLYVDIRTSLGLGAGGQPFAAATSGAWHYVAGNYNGSIRKHVYNSTFIQDGAVTGNITAGDEGINIGYYKENGTTNRYFYGKIDEVRISNVARSNDWLRASYLNGSNQFNSFGSEESYGATISCSTDIATSTFESIIPTAIASSSPVSTTISCSSAGGCSITLSSVGLNNVAGLASSTVSALIESPTSTATSTLSAGQDAFGIQVSTSTTGSGGTLSLNSRYAQTGSTIGHVSTTAITLASSSASITSRELQIKPYATVSAVTPAGPGYSDTFTITCTAN